MSIIERGRDLDRFFKNRSFIIDSPGIHAEKQPDGRVQVRAQVQRKVKVRGPSAIEDSYSESNQDSFADLALGGPDTAYGQSFTASFTGYLEKAAFYLRKDGSPTGIAVARLYTHGGTYGTSSLPVSPLLATSDNFDVSTLPINFTVIYLDFTGANQVALVNGTHYVITFEWLTPGGGKVDVGRDISSPTHSGNAVEFNATTGFWQTIPTMDTPFYVYAFHA